MVKPHLYRVRALRVCGSTAWQGSEYAVRIKGMRTSFRVIYYTATKEALLSHNQATWRRRIDGIGREQGKRGAGDSVCLDEPTNVGTDEEFASVVRDSHAADCTADICGLCFADRSEERRVGKECRYWRDWSSDVCSSDLKRRFSVIIRPPGEEGLTVLDVSRVNEVPEIVYALMNPPM